MSWEFTVFAGTGLLLASLGIYGVIGYSIAQRTHEFGVCIALGADRRTIGRMVVQQGMSMAAIGLLLGILAALPVTRAVSSLWYDVTPTDPATFAIVAGVFSVAALAASWVSALSAARIDPLMALRAE